MQGFAHALFWGAADARQALAPPFKTVVRDSGSEIATFIKSDALQ
jgi:hypothetical protein